MRLESKGIEGYKVALKATSRAKLRKELAAVVRGAKSKAVHHRLNGLAYAELLRRRGQR